MSLQQTAHTILARWLRKVADNEIESEILSTLRDTLLPKLISGELRVNDVDRFVFFSRDDNVNRKLRFNYIFVDMFKLEPYQQVNAFNDSLAISQDRVTRQIETDIVKWVINKDVCRKLLFNELSITSTLMLDGIKDKCFPNSMKPKGGDIDFICLQDNNHFQAVCIEFKKVKIRIDANGDERINHLGGLETLIQQGNLRRSQGFFKTYICVVSLIDNHLYKTPNIFTRRKSGRYNCTYNIDEMQGINNEVGIILIEITQPTGKPYNEMFGFGTCNIKNAVGIEQSRNLTKEIEHLFRRMRA